MLEDIVLELFPNKEQLDSWCREGSGIKELLGAGENHEEGNRKQPQLLHDWVAPHQKEMVFCEEKVLKKMSLLSYMRIKAE